MTDRCAGPGIVLALVSGCVMINPDYDEAMGDGTADGIADETGSGDSNGAGSSTSAEGNGEGTAGGEGTSGDEGTSGPDGPTSAESSDGSDGSSIDTSCPTDDPDLLLCLDFEAVAGGIAPDGSVFGNDASVENATVIDGPSGKALQVDASTTISVPCTDECLSPDAISLEATVRLDAYPSPPRGGVIDDDGQFGILVTSAGELRCQSTIASVDGGQLELGTWHRLVCVVDGDTLAGYIDGVEVSSNSHDEPIENTSDEPISVANTSPDWDEPIVGAIDEVRAWSRAIAPR